NNNADRLGLAGRRGTPDEIGAIVTAFAGELLGREIPPPTPAEPSVGEDPPPTLTFADSDPIRVKFEANRIVVTVRLGLASPPKADGSAGEDVPPQRVSIPFDVALSETGELKLTRGPLAVAPLGRPESRFRQQAIGRILQSRLGSEIPEEIAAPTATVIPVGGEKRVPVRLAALELADGWATVELR
ncbi:MAG: hypothetical protein AAF907_07720, partial [Planctomycetota bacterium]